MRKHEIYDARRKTSLCSINKHDSALLVFLFTIFMKEKYFLPLFDHDSSSSRILKTKYHQKRKDLFCVPTFFSENKEFHYYKNKLQLDAGISLYFLRPSKI